MLDLIFIKHYTWQLLKNIHFQCKWNIYWERPQNKSQKLWMTEMLQCIFSDHKRSRLEATTIWYLDLSQIFGNKTTLFLYLQWCGHYIYIHTFTKIHLIVYLRCVHFTVHKCLPQLKKLIEKKFIVGLAEFKEIQNEYLSISCSQNTK